jgi:AraC family transcriptional regulator
MDVQLVNSPLTKVAAIEHFGSPELEHETARKLVAWKIENRLTDPMKHCSYGIHFTDPENTAMNEHRVSV